MGCVCSWRQGFGLVFFFPGVKSAAIEEADPTAILSHKLPCALKPFQENTETPAQKEEIAWEVLDIEILNNSVIIAKVIKDLQYAFSSTTFLGS